MNNNELILSVIGDKTELTNLQLQEKTGLTRSQVLRALKQLRVAQVLTVYVEKRRIRNVWINRRVILRGNNAISKS